MKKSYLFGGLMVASLAVLMANMNRIDAQAPVAATSDVPLKHAQRELAMLDDLYKTAIVLITTHYVDDRDSLPAGSAFKALFDAMKAKQWHEVRLVDGTGDPYEPANAAHEGFETKAMEKILAGESKVEEVVTQDGKRYLLGATAIPVVMEKCILCHESYRDVPAGKAIGALSYKIPLQDE
jgi:hypothetical protein